MTNEQTIRTTCPYCGVGCGVLVRTGDGIEVAPDPEHPANLGRLCSKGSALAETVGVQGRLFQPLIDGQPAGWDEALDRVATKFRETIERHGPDSVAFYVSGQLLTEDYYAANKLMKGWIGSANIDTNSRLCMSSAVAAYKRAFGTDTVPCSYEDLERAKLVVLAGSNAAWCHPVLYQRLVKARREHPDLRVVLIDPRRTASADIADLHLPIRPGTDGWLWNGLLVQLAERGEGNPLYLQFVEGSEEALAAARESSPDIDTVARICGLEPERVAEFYDLWCRTERVVSVFSQGMNQSTSGTDKGNALINCHLYTGRIGRPGMGPFSFTGQPNAMGGREVGGLANQLAAHLELDNPEHRRLVQDFWQSPRIAERPGLKAAEMFQAVREGRIKALWIMATNPAVSLPDADTVRQALAECEFLVVSDCTHPTDTTRLADVVFAAQTWGEKDGMVTNSERRISRQRAFMAAPGEARPDWWIIAQVARRMGFEQGFDWQSEADVFREHARLSAFRPEVERDFDLGALADISDAQYRDWTPKQWPLPADRPEGTERLFGNGRFWSQSGKARMLPITPRGPARATSEEYPLVLNTGRVRDHWHTMTRTGKSPRLSGHIVEPYAELHPDDAGAAGIEEGMLVRVTGPRGHIIVRARLSDNQQPGSVFVPMHWNDQFSHGSYVNRLFPVATDPVSGQPEFKHNPVRVEPWQAGWYGFLLSRREVDLSHATYWAKSRGKGIWRYEIAGSEPVKDWARCAREVLCTESRGVNWIEFYDAGRRTYRAARLEEGRLESCLFIGPSHELPPRDWLIAILEQDEIDEATRRSLLTGKPGAGQEDAGRIVCSCFGVGLNTIRKAILEQGLTTPEAIGERLRAGTNCGSCVPELRSIIEQTLAEQSEA